TRPPALSGRGLKARSSPVQVAAERGGIAVETPRGLRDGEAASRLAAHRPDVVIVVAYGVVLPRAILDVPRLGCLNLHASLLPRWRGAAPIQRAILAGDRGTGVAAMRMEEGLDTGPVAVVERLAIGPDETAGELHDRLARAGAGMIVRALELMEAGPVQFVPQTEAGITYAAKITNEEARVDWSGPAGRVHDQVRGLSPAPGAFVEIDLGRGPERLKILRTARAEGEGLPGTLLGDERVACGEGAVRLLSVQRAGRGPVSAEEFLRGARLAPGARFA
ncbi:MAG: methionyl-tRNA formyltransferase, partial [Methylobacteriaceae bacterium]|nr:methionyl-tRNA formyltransferase [Methylobacteriaceae bacterium]